MGPADSPVRKRGAWERLWDWYDGKTAAMKVVLTVAVLSVIMLVGVVGINAVLQAAGPVDLPQQYVKEYGGDLEVYEEIFTSTDCAELQTFYDSASQSEAAAAPGSAEHRESTGYLTAAEVTLQGVGCRE